MIAILLVVVPGVLLVSAVILFRAGVQVLGGWPFWNAFGLSAAIVFGVALFVVLSWLLIRWSKHP